MAAETVQGLAEANALFDRIPAAAESELATTLQGIGEDVLAAERRDVAKRTGALSAALAIQLLIEQLRARIGLIGAAAKRAFYGRFVEFGRHAQTVLAKRRNGREYRLRVGALPARPFILVERPEVHASQRLANFWADVLNKAGR